MIPLVSRYPLTRCRKLVVTFPTPELPPILALSDYITPNAAFDTQMSASPEFAMHMATFHSHFMFWQDVLDHCSSAEIKRTLLDHFEILFLKQVLCVYRESFCWAHSDHVQGTLH